MLLKSIFFGFIIYLISNSIEAQSDASTEMPSAITSDPETSEPTSTSSLTPTTSAPETTANSTTASKGTSTGMHSQAVIIPCLFAFTMTSYLFI